jgi:signal transduction histidine kinase/CheY-like chemotaxis protein
LTRQITDSRSALRTKVTELEAEQILRTETEAQFRQAQKLEGLGQLATGVAHDFNNYLYVISLMAEDMLMDDPDNEKLEVILSSTKGASEICDRMLSYAGRTSASSKHYDVAALTREIEPVIRAAIPKSVAVQFDVSDRPLFTLGDPTVISQCLTNLVNNSYESIQESNGTILVSVFRSRLSRQLSPGWRVIGSTDIDQSPDSRVVVLEVSDTGLGMTDEILDRAFDPYFSTKTTSGHGFGLAITLGIVRGAGGQLLCNTTAGSGTTIQILLPRTNAPLIVPNSQPSEIKPVRANRLLLVDDEKSVRDGARDLLVKAGYDVTLASSAKAAVELISESARTFDVILSDHTMPDQTGLELLNNLRERKVRTPFVLCSGYEPDSIEGLKEAKPDAFLHKPFRLTQLEQVLVNIDENMNSPNDLPASG